MAMAATSFCRGTVIVVILFAYLHTHIYIYIYVCVCIYMYIQLSTSTVSWYLLKWVYEYETGGWLGEKNWQLEPGGLFYIR